MNVFRRLFFAALFAGIFSGVVITAAHQVGTVPIILNAEVYEKAAEAHGHPGVAHEHADHEAAIAQTKPEAWEPQDGLERTLYTGLADILTGIGFALLLVAAYSLNGRQMNGRIGVLWGLAGYATFMLAPSLGLPPEVPGTVAAALKDRQLWWVATVMLTGSSLYILAFRRRLLWVLGALVMIALPHLIGAPQVDVPSSAAPEALAQQFAIAALLVGLLFWLSLGASTGYLYSRIVQRT